MLKLGIMNGLPKMLQSSLWSYDISNMDIKRDKKLIIAQIIKFVINFFQDRCETDCIYSLFL